MAELAYVINSRQQLPEAYNAMAAALSGCPDEPHELSIKPKKKTRTLSQNALLHMWFSELSQYLIKAGRKFATPEWCKDAMKHSFLGYEEKERVDVVTGEKITVRDLRKTRDLNTAAMHYFMNEIEAWCVSIGCLLTIPDSSEYMKLKREQNQ